MKTLNRIGYKNSKRYKEKQEKKRQKSKAREKARNKEKAMQRNIVFRLYQTIMHYFPDLFEKMRQIEDCRSKVKYQLIDRLIDKIPSIQNRRWIKGKI